MNNKLRTVALLVDPASIVGKFGVVRAEVVNSIANQVKKLIKEGYKPLLFVSCTLEYCRMMDWDNNLRAAIGKMNLEELFLQAFEKRHLKVCILESNTDVAVMSAGVVLESDRIPIFFGDIAKGWMICGKNEGCVIDDVFFASVLCECIRPEVVVVVSGKTVNESKELSIKRILPESVKSLFVPFYKSDFFYSPVIVMTGKN